MDNLQEIGIYLGALLDGEGYVQLSKHDRKNNKIRLLATLSWSNTDIRIIEQLRTLLNQCGVNHHVYQSTRNVAKGGKPDFTVSVHRLTMVKKLLDIVLASPYLSKRSECSLLLEFVKGRIGPDGKPWPRGGKGEQRSTPYTERDFELHFLVNTYGNHKYRTPQRAYVQQA